MALPNYAGWNVGLLLIEPNSRNQIVGGRPPRMDGDSKKVNRPVKITLGEMREMGVRGVLVYCSDYKCSWEGSAPIDGPMMSACPILSRCSCATLAAQSLPISGQTFIGR